MIIIILLYFSFGAIVLGSDIFHMNSKTIFYPNAVKSNYFGYSVLLTKDGLIVGAPKASRIVGRSAGDVFTCPTTALGAVNVSCKPLTKKLKLGRSVFDKHDSWFGAALADIPDGTLFACAPLIKILIDDGKNIRIDSSDGSCYVHGKKGDAVLSISKKEMRFRGENRKDYANHFSDKDDQKEFRYQQFGLFGTSITYTKDNTVVIAAPNVMEGAGSIFHYKYHRSSFTFEKLTSPNPYFTNDLKPDDYFGFSLASGVFEKNGHVLYVGGAPRSKRGYGQVLIIEKPVEEKAELKIKAKVSGPQLGSYFGYSVCTPDLNMDGVSDLVVGAPNYAVVSSGVLTYDQGAVFVYLTRQIASGFILEEAGVVKGSGDSGARFGTSIADLGDIDGDGFTDVAIGAPWENNGTGAVYIYKGTKNGLMSQYAQRIITENGKGFGISISRGYDVDANNCNDLAIGAFDSSTAYLYRGVPTIQVLTSIKVPDLKDLKKDASNFTAHFCLTVQQKKSWPNVEIRLNAKVTVDPDQNRAKIIGKSQYDITTKAYICTQKTIEIDTEADFSRPMLIQFDVTPVNLDALSGFPLNSARLSEDSNLQSSIRIQMLSDCGDDVCKPWLVMDLKPWNSSYHPGVNTMLGFHVSVTNTKEPAFSVKLHLVLPYPPRKLPESCALKDLDLTCDLPEPLNRNQTVEWEIQLEYTWNGVDTELLIAAELKDPLYMRNITEGTKELVIPIVPHVNYTLNGIAQPNNTVYVTRHTFDKHEDVLFTHYYEVTNLGPSDLYNLKVEFSISEELSLTSTIEGSISQGNNLTLIPIALRANTTTGYTLPLLFKPTQFGEILSNSGEVNVTSKLYVYVPHGLYVENRTLEVTTLLVLEPPLPLRPLIVASVSGLLLLAGIMLGLYKCGFFSRPKKEDLKQLIENKASQESPSNSPSQGPSNDGRSSTQEIGQ